jgi:DNA-binding LacI/PurR family transcriptional regulator
VSEPHARFFSEPFFAGMVRGVSAALAETGVQLLLLIAQALPDRGWLERYVVGGHVDGVLLASLHGDDPLPGTLERAGVPAVLIGRPVDRGGPGDRRGGPPADRAAPGSYVDADNRGGARQAVEHLVVKGRSRIATITGPADMPVGIDRLDGYRDALEAAGLPLEPSMMVAGDFSQASGTAAMEQLLTLQPPIDGVFAASDLMAAGAMQTLVRSGRRVPEDVAVVGFDDSATARSTDPPLTSVRQPLVEMGRTMASLLLHHILEADAAPNTVILPTELVVRSSA